MYILNVGLLFRRLWFLVGIFLYVLLLSVSKPCQSPNWAKFSLTLIAEHFMITNVGRLPGFSHQYPSVRISQFRDSLCMHWWPGTWSCWTYLPAFLEHYSLSGRLSGSAGWASVRLLISAWVVISGSWDGVLPRAPPQLGICLRFSLSLLLPLPCSHALSFPLK